MGKRRRVASRAFAGVLAGLAVAGVVTPLAQSVYTTPTSKVTLCHATASTSNPYVKVAVDPASVLKEGHGSHTGAVFTPGMTKGWGDIIPSFGTFKGLNLTDAGRAILASNCKVAVNRAPVVSSAAADSIVKEGDIISTSGSFNDPDGDALTLTADNLTGTFTDNGNGTWTFTQSTNDDIADTLVTVTANDGKGGTVSDSFSFSAINVAPTVTTSSTAADDYGCSVNIDQTVSDPGTADTFTYDYVFGSTTSAESTHRFVSAGTYEIATTVTDDNGGVGTDSLSHTVYNRALDGGPVLPESPTFQLDRDIPLKLGVVNCSDEFVTGLELTVRYAPVVDGVVGAYSDATSDANGQVDVGPLMRVQDEGYHYTFKSDGLAAGTYRIAVFSPTFVAPVHEDVVIVNSKPGKP